MVKALIIDGEPDLSFGNGNLWKARIYSDAKRLVAEARKFFLFEKEKSSRRFNLANGVPSGYAVASNRSEWGRVVGEVGSEITFLPDESTACNCLRLELLSL